MSSSRPPNSRNTTSAVPYVTDPESLILPDGPVGEDAAELLQEFAHPHHHAAEDTLVGSSDDEGDDGSKTTRPWWKTPSPWWLIAAMPLSAIAMACTLAPRIEIYTMLVCSVYKPDILNQNHRDGVGLRNVSDPIWDLGHATTVNPHASSYSPLLTLFASKLAGLFAVASKSSSTLASRCASDPVVQAEVARLTAVITTTTGVLSCITTGWWGAFSDRHGRTRVMGISVLGLLVLDFNFIAIATFWRHLPGGYWLLVIGPFVEGCLGGMTTGVAATHGYMADTTNEGVRSRMFSLSLGLLFTGMAIGPTLGSLLIHYTGKTISVFYAATFVHILYTIFVWTILPESLSEKRRMISKAKYDAEMAEVTIEREQNPAVSILVRLRRLFAFLSPLAVFMPAAEKNPGSSPLKAPKKDWNLTLIALGYAFTITLMGSYSVKFQYAASAFHWNSEIIGYWLSLIGATRALFLTIVLPIVIKLFKPKPVIIETPVAPTETTPLVNSRNDDRSQTPSSSSTQVTKTIKKEVHSPLFDLNLARVSLFLDIISYVGMGLATKSGLFTVFGMMGAFGAGFSPAVQSVALTLYSRRGGTEIGRLFGALSVLQALCSQIIGPTLYGLVYMKTVAVYPAAIFFVSFGSVFISLVLFGFVRLSKKNDVHRESVADLEEPTRADADSGIRVHVLEETLVDTSESDDAGVHSAQNKRDAPPSYGVATSGA